MKTDRFFEMKGHGGVYQPASKVITPTVVSNYLYPQLMMLLIGMVAGMSVRNHMHPRSWSLPLDLIAVCSGAALFAGGYLQHNTELTSKGMILAGAGFGSRLSRARDQMIE